MQKNTVKRNENSKSNSHQGGSYTQRTLKMGEGKDDSKYFVQDFLKKLLQFGNGC